MIPYHGYHCLILYYIINKVFKFPLKNYIAELTFFPFLPTVKLCDFLDDSIHLFLYCT